jgi:hypothetical protein
VAIQAWDFRPGANFVLEMQKAAQGTARTIAILSQNYLASEFTQPEWAAAFAVDPTGQDRKLIPIRVSTCSPTGLLKSIVYVDLVGLPAEDARSAILGAFTKRAKPEGAPSFPGSPKEDRVAQDRKEYPGVTHTASVVHSLHVDQQVAVQVDRQRLSPQERLNLAQKLNSIAPQQFNMLAFALNPPPGLIPPMPAPHGDRSHALLSWAEGSGGCGLATVTDVVRQIIVGSA